MFLHFSSTGISERNQTFQKLHLLQFPTELILLCGTTETLYWSWVYPRTTQIPIWLFYNLCEDLWTLYIAVVISSSILPTKSLFYYEGSSYEMVSTSPNQKAKTSWGPSEWNAKPHHWRLNGWNVLAQTAKSRRCKDTFIVVYWNFKGKTL